MSQTQLTTEDRRERTAALRDAVYVRLLDALRAVGPDAPTQCEGWTAQDIATHAWIMKHDPLGAPGYIVPALKGLTERRADKALAENGGYEGVLDALEEENGARYPVIGGTQMMALADLGEWYVHLRDVLDPNGLPEAEIDLYTRRALWLDLQVIAKMQRPDAVLVEPVLGKSATFGDGSRTVTGDAGDLLCWVFGRRADVRIA